MKQKVVKLLWQITLYLPANVELIHCGFEAEFEALKPENNNHNLLFNVSSQNISEFIQSQKYLLLKHDELQEVLEVFPNVCSVSPFSLSESVLTAGDFSFLLAI